MSEHHKHARQTPYLLFILALSVLAIVMVLIERAARLTPEERHVLDLSDYAICVIFFIDFAVTLIQAPNRWRYLATWGWLDLLSSVPAIEAFRFARSARIVRIFRVLRALRAARILSLSFADRRAAHGLATVAVVAATFLVASSASVLQVEQVPDANIRGADDAIWWAPSTMTSVGYGDRFPVTAEGRVVGAVLMICGVALFGTLSGFLAAWFVQPGDERSLREIAAVRSEIGAIRELLEGRRPNSTPV